MNGAAATSPLVKICNPKFPPQKMAFPCTSSPWVSASKSTSFQCAKPPLPKCRAEIRHMPTSISYSKFPIKITGKTRIVCAVALEETVENLQLKAKVGDRVKVRGPLKVYHVPKTPELDIGGMEGEVKDYVAFWKDDLIYMGSNEKMNEQFKLHMMAEFEMKELGLMSYFLGMEVHQTSNGIFVCQQKYAMDMLKKFGMNECKPVDTPIAHGEYLCKEDGAPKTNKKEYRSIVGSLMFLTNTRPDLQFVVSLVARYMSDPSFIHLKAAKRLLRYVRGTTSFGIHYSNTSKFKLTGFSDSDWGSDLDDRKSTSGNCFSLGSGLVTWSSKKQSVVALSSTEAEYVALTGASTQALWLRKILKEIGEEQRTSTLIFCDNQSAIKLAHNPIHHSRSKHFDLKTHFIRDVVEKGVVSLSFCPTHDQVADIFTKAVAKTQFMLLRDLIVGPLHSKGENVGI